MKQNWIEIELGKICKLKNGYAFKSSNYKNEGVPIIRISDIRDGIVSGLNAKKVDGQDDLKDYIIENNSILVAMSGATTGKFGIYRSKEKAYQNQRVGKFEIINENLLNNEFLYYQLHALKRQIEKDAYGGAQPNISSKKIEAMNVILFPLPLQRAIVSKIEQLFSELDNGIQNLQQANQKLAVFRQAVLKKAFEDCSNLEKLETISDSCGGFAFKSKDFKEKGKYQIIRIGNVREGNLRLETSPVFIDEINEKIEDKYLLKKGDVVISLTGTRFKRDYGYTAIVSRDNLLLNQRLAYIRFQENYASKFFLYYSWTKDFKDQFFDAETGNTGQGNVGMKAIKETLIPIVSII